MFPTLLSIKPIRIFPPEIVCSGKYALAVTKPLVAYKRLISLTACWISPIVTFLPSILEVIALISSGDRISESSIVTDPI